MAYTVIRVYMVDRYTVDIVEPEDISPREIQDRINSPNVHAYLSLQEVGVEAYVDFDYSHFITDFNVNSKETWAQISSLLTEEIVQGYSCSIPGYKYGSDVPHSPVVLWDATNTLYTFAISYSDYLSESESKYALRWKQRDLRIRLRPEAPVVPDLTRCIPIVNGICCKPYYSEQSKYLYALDGAKLLWQTGVHITPEVQLLDFSDIGDVECVEMTLSDLEPDKIKVDTNGSIYNEWTFKCNNFNLKEYTPLVVLGGCVIWSKDIKIVGEHEFSINPSLHCLEACSTWRKYLTSEANSNAMTSYDAESLYDHFRSEMEHGESRECFVCMIHTSGLFYRVVRANTWKNNVVMDLFAPIGILIRNTTETITAFHNTEFADRQELIVQNLEDLYIGDERIELKHEGFVKCDCRHHEFRRLQDSSYTMLYAFTKE